MTAAPPNAGTASAVVPRTSPGFGVGLATGALVALALAGAVALWRPSAPADGAPGLDGSLSTPAETNPQVLALRGQLAAADAELAIERAARRALEDNLAALQAQAGQLRDRVAFYDQLFPAGPAGTVSIRAIEATRVPSGLRYRVLLMRSARPGLAPFAGGLRFVATGTRAGEPVRLALAPLQAGPVPGPGDGAAQAPAGVSAPTPSHAVPTVVVPLQVDQYRASEGILALPADFTPTRLSVDVVRDGVILATQEAAVAF